MVILHHVKSILVLENDFQQRWLNIFHWNDFLMKYALFCKTWIFNGKMCFTEEFLFLFVRREGCLSTWRDPISLLTVKFTKVLLESCKDGELWFSASPPPEALEDGQAEFPASLLLQCQSSGEVGRLSTGLTCSSISWAVVNWKIVPEQNYVWKSFPWSHLTVHPSWDDAKFLVGRHFHFPANSGLQFITMWHTQRYKQKIESLKVPITARSYSKIKYPQMLF